MDRRMRVFGPSLVLAASAFFVAGCGSALDLNTHNDVFRVAASTDHATTTQTVRMSADMYSGGAAEVAWSVRADDAAVDAGHVDVSGVYTPPAFVDRDALHVTIEAQLAANHSLLASQSVDVYPAVSLAPENVALTAGSVTTLYATIAETGGGSLDWSVADSPSGVALPASYGRFSDARCKPSAEAFTQCTVLFTAPVRPVHGLLYARAALAANPGTYTAARVLLNGTADTTPLDNEALQTGGNAALGASGGNINDSAGQYCCGGTLGALVKIGGTDYILGNNHVLARTDEAAAGEGIVQPGLTDTQCGYDPSNTVAQLSYAPRLHDPQTNVDAAIAEVSPGSIRTDGAILSLGGESSDRTLAAAPPASDPEDITESGHTLPMLAKSGRSTGLTCAPVSEIAVDVKVEYNTACDGSGSGFTKVFRNQIAVAGAGFSDTGDSGSLLLDQQTAQPVGMMYAGNSTDTFANPVGDVLRALEPFARAHGSSSAEIVGGAHHAIACMNYDTASESAASEALPPLSEAEVARAQSALQAIEAGTTALHVSAAWLSVGRSKDETSQSAIVVRVPEGAIVPAVPQTILGVRIVVLRGVDEATAASLSSVARREVDAAIAVKQRIVQEFLADPAVFAIGVGASRDNPAEAAIVVFVDGDKRPAYAPATVDQVRIAYRSSDAPRAFHWKEQTILPRSCGSKPNAQTWRELER